MVNSLKSVTNVCEPPMSLTVWNREIRFCLSPNDFLRTLRYRWAYCHNHIFFLFLQEVQPIRARCRGRQDDQVLRCCAASNCRRWFHRTTCLRRGPFEPLVRDGCAEAFTCPAHTCLQCQAETPGIWPHPTSYFIHCFLCPATFHVDEWCVPAGLIWVSDISIDVAQIPSRFWPHVFSESPQLTNTQLSLEILILFSSVSCANALQPVFCDLTGSYLFSSHPLNWMTWSDFAERLIPVC